MARERPGGCSRASSPTAEPSTPIRMAAVAASTSPCSGMRSAPEMASLAALMSVDRASTAPSTSAALRPFATPSRARIAMASAGKPSARALSTRSKTWAETSSGSMSARRSAGSSWAAPAAGASTAPRKKTVMGLIG